MLSVELPGQRGPDSHRPSALNAAAALGWREVVRFLRQRNRVVGAVGQPILFWLLFGVGMNRTFQVPGQRFSVYFVPGILVLILLFTAIFATISVIEDRKEGFLQSVLVAPVPRWSLVLGKVIGGTILAVGQSLIFLSLSLTLGIRLSVFATAELLALMTLTSIGLTCLGLILAWRMDSTQGFHAIMNLLLMPMWLLSGAFFPVPPATADITRSEWVLHAVMRLNPVTYAVSGVRQLLLPVDIRAAGEVERVLWTPSLSACWLVTGLFALVMFGLATRIVGRATRGDLQ